MPTKDLLHWEKQDIGLSEVSHLYRKTEVYRAVIVNVSSLMSATAAAAADVVISSLFSRDEDVKVICT